MWKSGSVKMHQLSSSPFLTLAHTNTDLQYTSHPVQVCLDVLGHTLLSVLTVDIPVNAPQEQSGNICVFVNTKTK